MTQVTKIPVGAVLPQGSQEMLILRDLTRRTGTIQEPQALNLRVWPRGFLGVVSSTAYYTHANLSIEFQVGDFDADGKPKAFDDRLRYLDAAVKFLLGLDVTVRVTKGGSLLYEGKAATEEEWLSLTSIPTRKKSTRTGSKTKTSRR
jgi:hypothetical protein